MTVQEQATLTQELRMKRFETLMLMHGSHRTANEGMCVMEAVAYVAGEAHSYQPSCACPVITAALVRLNDRMPNDETRTKYLKPLVMKVIGTRATRAVELKRAYVATDFVIRTSAPRWLELAKQPQLAAKLRELPEVTDAESARAARKIIWAVRDEAWKVRADAWARWRAERAKLGLPADADAADADAADAAVAAAVAVAADADADAADAADADAAAAVADAVAADARSLASLGIEPAPANLKTWDQRYWHYRKQFDERYAKLFEGIFKDRWAAAVEVVERMLAVRE